MEPEDPSREHMNPHNGTRHRRLRIVLLCTAALVGVASLSPRSSASSTNPEQQRQQFLQAEQLLKQGHRGQYQNLLGRLRDYPLYPYLLFEDLRQRLDSASPREIGAFLDRFADTPLAPRLRGRWLRSLAKHHRWGDYIHAYQPTDDGFLQCNYRRALLETGHRRQALAGIGPLWRTGQSLPDACDPVLETWEASGNLTPDLAWERIRLAMEAGNPRLGRYLGRYLPEAQRKWVEAWYRVYRKPTRLLKSDPVRAPEPARGWIVMNGLERLASINPHDTAESWRRILARYHLTAEQRGRLVRRIALSLAYDGDPEAGRWLLKVPSAQCTARVRNWRVRSALNQQDWPQVLHWLNRLPAGEKNDTRWRYWRARALEALGHQHEAERIYARLARTRTYEGFLAADRIGVSYSFENQALDFTSSQLQQLAHRPGIRRARELFALNRLLDARREWYAATRDLNDMQLQQAAKLAQSWGWYDRAILTLGRSRYRDDLKLRFPIVHRKVVLRQAHRVDINPAWAYAVMRKESAFNTEARSQKGALGLMQLLPQTARRVARDMNIRWHRSAQLYHPRFNIRVGMTYLRMVLDRFGDHPVLATAAYNAGTYRVRQWLPTAQSVPADIWIETLPYGETRDYLRSVLAFTAIYERRLGQRPTRLLRRMPPVAPRDGKLSSAPASTRGKSGRS
ncbi:MAG: transglycosylase SLT domain-containing protein [Gammaproteobacteria bacterium]